MAKLHPSITISIRDRATVYEGGVCRLFRAPVEEAYDFAAKLSEELRLRDLRESPLAA